MGASNQMDDFITQEMCNESDTGLSKAPTVETRCLIPTPNNHPEKSKP